MTLSRSLPVLAALAMLQSGCPRGKVDNPPPSSDAATDEQVARMFAAKWNVRADVQMIELLESRAIELLPGLRSDDGPKFDAALAQLQQMIRAKEATLVGWPEVAGLDGVRSSSETLDEPALVLPDEPPPAADAAPPAGSRNAGVSLEAEVSVLDEGKRLLVTAAPQHVRLLGFTDDANAQPAFSTSSTLTTVNIRNGQHVFLAMHKPEPGKDTVELFILHAAATKIE